ncbi:Cu/Pi carrier [Rhizina undulata]
MPGLIIPSPSTLSAFFPSPYQKPSKVGPVTSELYTIASVNEDGRNPGSQLSAAATAELAKASGRAPNRIEMYSPKFYAACVTGGLLACGLTHTAVTPLDLVKCRRQVNASLYASNVEGWKTIVRAEGVPGIFTGYSPTFFGYSAQGAFKYGGYEFFKKFYSDLLGPESALKHKTWIYLAGSASAEFIADIALCPFEAVKVRMQTSMPPEFKGTVDGLKGVVAKEGVAGLYKGLYPLWGRQIPYTMMKFASFENTVEFIYSCLPRKKSEYGKGVQTSVSFAGGYIAGILCALVSHPADVMVSKLNANRQPGEAFGAAMGRIYKEIGFAGLWNGLPVRIVMIGTLTGLQWLLYDGFKIFVGLPTTGGVAEKLGEVGVKK